MYKANFSKLYTVHPKACISKKCTLPIAILIINVLLDLYIFEAKKRGKIFCLFFVLILV